MKLRHVDPRCIKVPEIRVTARFDPEVKAQFEASIKGMGIIAPVLVCEIGEDLVLIDGLHRLQEAMKDGLKLVDVAVIPGDMIDVLTRNIFIDHLRGKTPPSEMVKVVEALFREYGLDSEKIATKTGLTREYVEKLQAISELTPYCRQMLDEGRIGIGQAYELSRLKDPIAQETVMGQILLYRWTVGELRDHVGNILEIVKSQEAPVAPSAPTAPVKIKCRFCGGDYEVAEISNPNVCVSCAGIMFAAIAQARAEAATADVRKETASGREAVG